VAKLFLRGGSGSRLRNVRGVFSGVVVGWELRWKGNYSVELGGGGGEGFLLGCVCVGGSVVGSVT